MASALDFLTLDVFTSTHYLGNPLAVVLVPAAQASTLTQERKQLIAREFNLSETAFLHVPEDPLSTERRVDIFTIEEELPFAGHPTIGSTYLVLKHFGLEHVRALLLKGGRVKISKTGGEAEGRVLATIPHDVHLHKNTLRSIYQSDDSQLAEHVRAALSDDVAIRQAELDAPVVSIVKGMSFVLVQLPSIEHLAKVTTAKRLDFTKLTGLLDAGPWEKSFTARYYYAMLESSEGAKTVRIQARMVEMGMEDPATGSAASTLTSYLTLQSAADNVEYEIVQGVEMGRRSHIAVAIEAVGAGEARKIVDLKLGGTARVVMKGTLV